MSDIIKGGIGGSVLEQQVQNEKAVAEGYAFLNEDDAKKALSESRRILQLEEKLDYAKPES
jgi:hypothetical protein